MLNIPVTLCLSMHGHTFGISMCTLQIFG